MGKFKFVNGVMIDTSKPEPSNTVQPIPMAIVATPDQLAEVSSDYQTATGKPMVIPTATAVAIEKYTDDPKFTDKFNTSGLDHEKMLDQLSSLFAKYEVPVGMLAKLNALSEYSLSIIVDDSGSMGAPTDSLKTDAMSETLKQRFGSSRDKMSRWQEEEDRLHMMVDFLAYIPTGPIKVMCMNRSDTFTLVHNHKTPEQFAAEGHDNISKMFDSRGPGGGTPTMAMMKKTFSGATGRTMHYLFTDGVPSDCSTEELALFLKNRSNPQNNPLTLVSCTDEDSECAWMKEIEEVGPFMVEVDDYSDEREEVFHDQGPSFPYSRGFWIMCLLVGAINPHDLDAMDDSRPFTKYTLENLLGRPLTDVEYSKYWAEHPRAKEYQSSYSRFCTEPKHAGEILGTDNAVPLKKLTGLMGSLFKRN
jgi:hypothetical protein